MHDSPKLTSFIALRANGWSLASIARQIDVPKSTLWEWDTKHQNEIHLLKHAHLEKLQEKYLPTYEEELSSMRSYLDRLEAVLEKRDFKFTDSGALLQMALQVRTRMARMREQVPLRSIPLNQPLAPIPFTGCVTRKGKEQFRPQRSEHDGSSRTSSSVCSASSAVDSGVPRSDTAEAVRQNRTKPDETPPTGKNASLNINDLQQILKNGRPVLHSAERASSASPQPNPIPKTATAIPTDLTT